MIRREITPIANITRRAPEAGRIRLGDKGGKNGSQRSIDAFRFTSPDRPILEQIVQVYGGKVTAWNDPKASPSKQWQVYSEATEINVMLMPDGFDQVYEMWSGGGVKRRCDGVECQVSQRAGDDYELVMVDCICREEGKLSCNTYSRLNVVLPEFSFMGTWRVESKGGNAAAELPGMVDLILGLSERGKLVHAVLSIDKREKMVNGRKQNFVVPRLAVRTTVAELSAGTNTPSIGTGSHSAPFPQPELTVGYGELSRRPDTEIIEAEIIDEELLEIEALLRADAENFGLDPDSYVDAVKAGVAGDRERMRNCSIKVRAGQLEPINIAGGRVQWRSASTD